MEICNIGTKEPNMKNFVTKFIPTILEKLIDYYLYFEVPIMIFGVMLSATFIIFVALFPLIINVYLCLGAPAFFILYIIYLIFLICIAVCIDRNFLKR